jgi:hypothetical protein
MPPAKNRNQVSRSDITTLRARHGDIAALLRASGWAWLA